MQHTRALIDDVSAGLIVVTSVLLAIRNRALAEVRGAILAQQLIGKNLCGDGRPAASPSWLLNSK